MKSFLPLVAIVLLGFFAILPSCKDNSTSPVSESYQSAEDNAIPENEFSSIFDYVNAEGTLNHIISGGTSKQDITLDSNERSEIFTSCTTLTWDSATRTLTIDFGASNCLCRDGLYRRGTVFAKFNGPYRQIGSSVVITLQDYFVQDMSLSGKKTITILAAAKWHIVVENAKVITTDDKTITWNADRTTEKIEGVGTPTIWDDVYTYRGTVNGVNRNGVAYTATIDDNFPLKKKIKIGCPNFVSGKLTITNDKGGSMTIDYDPIGGEPCDRTADVTINGKTYRITLKR